MWMATFYQFDFDNLTDFDEPWSVVAETKEAAIKLLCDTFAEFDDDNPCTLDSLESIGRVETKKIGKIRAIAE